MLNARTGIATRLVAALALAVAPAFVAVAADDQGGKDALDMNAKMQEKLNSKLGGNIGNGALDIDSKLSERVNKKNAETNKQLDSQAESLTAAERGNNGGENEETADAEKKNADSADQH